MKTIRNKIVSATITLMLTLWVPLAASAADMWAKTPNLDAGSEDHGVKTDGEYRIISNFNPEMYAETPGLNNILPGPQPETMESTLLAKGK